MSLEKHGERRYYYRGRRVNGRFVKEYVAAGAEAEALAVRAQEERARRKELKEIERMLEDLEGISNLLFEAWMFAAGYHRPKRGPWRKRRDLA
jgi:hypothetical protein